MNLIVFSRKVRQVSSKKRYRIYILTAAIFSTFALGISSTQANSKPFTLVAQDLVNEGTLSGWQNFVSDAGEFKVLMPTNPAEFPFAPDPSITNGRMLMQMRLAESGHIEIYAVAFGDYTGDLSSPDSIDNALSGCAESLDKKGKIINKQNIELSNYRGVEVESQTSNGGMNVTRCYVVGQRLYILFANGEPFSLDSSSTPSATETTSIVRSESMNSFLNSFELLNKTEE